METSEYFGYYLRLSPYEQWDILTKPLAEAGIFCGAELLFMSVHEDATKEG